MTTLLSTTFLFLDIWVQIFINGKTSTSGKFDTPKKAALAYDQAAIKAGKKKSTLNFPDGLLILKRKSKRAVKNGGYIDI